MVGRIERALQAEPVRFVVAGDSGAWHRPTTDGIFRGLLGEIAELDPPPAFAEAGAARITFGAKPA